VDHHRRTHRESPLDTLEAPAPQPEPAPVAAELTGLARAVTVTLDSLAPEERYLLSSYFLDGQSLAQVGRVLHVHEATISRRLKRLLTDLRKRLLHHLQAGGLSKRAAEEALGNDPRDLEINLRALLQSSQINSFSEQAVVKAAASSGQP
jgi:RNA polymerase sigma-70 factor (ECF subfamily)